MAYKKKPKKQKQKIASAIAHVKSTFNNTIVSITTMEGDVLFSSSAGRLGFKGSRKSTPFAASQIASTLAKEMQLVGVKNLEVNMQGPGSGRDSVVRAFQSAGMTVSMLRDVTPLPHNGCRAPKKRRV
ncbi:MAG TPA: 30S ribosomal protein S11 [Candidatus Babeliales bacterium]|jgi:small subunit ribosomal protein S11|nr:30S ribosomal protein S11 [Candidatus Babeliales bacterium]